MGGPGQRLSSEERLLLERLGSYPPERYPVQHATTQFHLGSVLLHAGKPEPARAALGVARELFASAGMRLEAAKATVMLGVALRTAGRIGEARAAFVQAGADLADLGQTAEQAAAAYNLGLVCQDGGDASSAHSAWTTARELFLACGSPARAAAAARDHGSSLLTAGDVPGAVALLEEAVALAERAGDLPGLGGGANVLGLAHLAGGDPPRAVAALRSALACFPRSVRPGDHAMVKANLALAHEQAGEPARARLAAGQALAVTSAAAPVRRQAQEVLRRLPGTAPEALLTVLDDEFPEHWVPVVREEVLRLVAAPAAERERDVAALLSGLLQRPGTCYDLAESLLSVVLELPPAGFSTMVSALVSGSAGRDDTASERLRAVLGSAMARFPLPQWQRMAASLNAAATAAGQPAEWR